MELPRTTTRVPECVHSVDSEAGTTSTVIISVVNRPSLWATVELCCDSVSPRGKRKFLCGRLLYSFSVSTTYKFKRDKMLQLMYFHSIEGYGGTAFNLFDEVLDFYS